MSATKRTLLFGLVLTIGFSASLAKAASYTASQFSATPPFLSTSVDPFVLINLSVENTQQAEAFTDGEQTYANDTYCPGRKWMDPDGNHDYGTYGICYSGAETYIGYFDPKKCYDYVQPAGGASAETGRLQNVRGPWQGKPGDGPRPNVGYFKPVGATNNNHECSGKFSGNFMNWASMTALDEFRLAMTGGSRLVDTSGADAQTLLTRAHRYTHHGGWDSFIGKVISANGIWEGGHGFTTNPARVTPFNDWDERTIYVETNENIENRITFRDSDGDKIGTYNVIVEVCNPEVGVEPNCTEYTSSSDPSVKWFKPEGVLQRNAMKMRYALTSYTAQHGNGINGGVLRSNAKYVGYYRPALDGGIEANPVAEVKEDGTYAFDPDGKDHGSGVHNSGILNYINMFGLGTQEYKQNDPASEIYYEGIRYLTGLDPTPSFSANSKTTHQYKDGFPVFYDSESAGTDWSWEDPVVDACQKNFVLYIGDQFTHDDRYVPGKSCGDECSDAGFNAVTLTNAVGSFEGETALGDDTATSMNGGFWIAGMSFWALTSDIRPDMEGKQTAKTFIVDTQEWNSNPPTGKENPLWLAAKYGGFETEGWTSGTAPTDEQWDVDGDTVPNTYTLASQPENMIQGLDNAFNVMTSQINAGSAAGVSINTAAGEGMVVQGLFKPNHVVGGRKVEWGGLLHAIFVDEHDNFREDANQNGQLDAADPVITYDVDDAREKATISRYAYQGRARNVTDTPLQTGIEIDELDTIWDGRDSLAELTNTQVKTQRGYTTSAAGGRYVFTAIDGQGSVRGDNIVTQSDVVPFDEATFQSPTGNPTAVNYAYLGLENSRVDEAPDIVNYIRGVEDPSLGYRSRTIDYDSDGTAEAWRLGDIVSSSPVVVGSPGGGGDFRYDRLYGDESYTEFYDRYLNRRRMVYVGANDGMLHAFNAGFYNAADHKYDTTIASTEETETPHPLGSEVWAYVPFNVLPHLKWLAAVEYPHVYYVDGIPQVFDVNIFPNGPDHPGGWGTILVVGTRFGGGEYTLDVPAGTGTETATMRSGYIVLDITNPEEEPKLIAEVTHPQLGYTTGRPTVMKQRVISEGSDGNPTVTKNEWFLLFGSGPFGNNSTEKVVSLVDGVSFQTAKIFAFDLKDKAFVTHEIEGVEHDYYEVPDSANGFIGDLTVADWDKDFVDDVVYFGVVEGTLLNPSGDLMRFVPDSGFASTGAATINRLVTDGADGVQQPFSGQAYIHKYNNEHWVYMGSGRFYVGDDNLTTGQMSYYGVREPVDAYGVPTLSDSVDLADLLDTSEIEVAHLPNAIDSNIYRSGGSPVVIGGETIETFSELRKVIEEDYSGWMINFDDNKARNVGKSDGGFLDVGFTEYVGSGDMCEPLGDTFLNRVFYQTGTAAPYSKLSTDDTVIHGEAIADRSKYYTVGLVRDVDYVNDRFIGQGSLGNLPSPEIINGPAIPSGRVSWREITIDW